MGVGITRLLGIVIAIGLVIVELCALPFLIGIQCSMLQQKMSAITVLVTMVIWSIVEVSAYNHNVSVIFGATFELPGGGWSLTFIAALWLLLVLASGVTKHRRTGQ